MSTRNRIRKNDTYITRNRIQISMIDPIISTSIIAVIIVTSSISIINRMRRRTTSRINTRMRRVFY